MRKSSQGTIAMTATETGGKVLENVFENIRKAAETTLKMQQEVFQQWEQFWPTSTPQLMGMDKVREAQKRFSRTVSELVGKRRDVIDKQYQAAAESLDAALEAAQSTTPEEYRRRSEELCHKMLDCVRTISETQLSEFQEAVTKWTEFATKAATKAAT
jgi:hypothetical protein